MKREQLVEAVEWLAKIALDQRIGDIFIPLETRIVCSFMLEANGQTILRLSADDVTLDRMANDE